MIFFVLKLKDIFEDISCNATEINNLERKRQISIGENIKKNFKRKRQSRNSSTSKRFVNIEAPKIYNTRSRAKKLNNNIGQVNLAKDTKISTAHKTQYLSDDDHFSDHYSASEESSYCEDSSNDLSSDDSSDTEYDNDKIISKKNTTLNKKICNSLDNRSSNREDRSLRNNIAENAYCHQCRTKSTPKTNCYSENCKGFRAQICER